MLDLAKIVDSVELRVSEMKQEGKINFPKNYSPGNALRGALLILNEYGIENAHRSIRLRYSKWRQRTNPLKKFSFIVLGTKRMPTAF